MNKFVATCEYYRNCINGEYCLKQQLYISHCCSINDKQDEKNIK